MGSLSPNPPSTYSICNPFRTRILSGQISPLMTLKLTTCNEIAMLCKTTSLPGVFIDMEHSSFDLHAVSQLTLACHYAGVSALVRVPSPSNHGHIIISRVLDAGASAVVVPHVESIDEIRALVRSAKFAPLGARGCANMHPLLDFRAVPTVLQNETLNRETMLIPMIETPGAVELVDEFLAVEGVDGVLVGSNDLCSDLGIPGQYDHPLYQDAVTKVVLAGKKAGKPVGIGGIGGRLDLLEKWFAMGATWSLSGGDLAMLQAGMRKIGENYAEINQRVQKARSME